MGTLKPQSNGPPYGNTVIGTLTVDGWAVTFGTARRSLGGLQPRHLTKLTLYRHIETAEQQTTVRQYGDWYTGR